MKNERGVTLVTVIIMIVVITIIASVSIIQGVSVVKNANNQVNESNLADVKAVVARESAKFNTAGILTPANVTYYGEENATLTGIKYDDAGNKSNETKEIGEEWYYLDENALKEMGIEYANETYVVNYRKNVVIPVSTTENLHSEIERYNSTIY